MQFQKTALALCAAGLLSLPGLVAASGGPSGPAVTFAVQGNIGEVLSTHTNLPRSQPSFATVAMNCRMLKFGLCPSKTDRKSNIKFPNDS